MTEISVATFSLTQGDNGSQVSIIFSDGSSETISDNHENFDSIVAALINKPEGYGKVVFELANIPKTIGRKFRNLSNRVTTDGSEIYFDGDIIDDSLSQFILKLLREDAQKAAAFFDGGNTVEDSTEESYTWEALVKFLELLYSNPNDQSRNSLYNFISRYGLTIRKDGYFIAYKGLNAEFGSHNTGYGIVDGVEVNGTLMNLPGSVLRFPRKDVNANTGVGCAQGLHAGTHAYATQWARGGKLVAVAINPMNVVSVPDDCTFQKLRVCEYEVLNEVDPLEEVIATSGWDSSSFWSDDEEDEEDEDYCGEDCCDEEDDEDDDEDYCGEDCCDQDSEDEDGDTNVIDAIRNLVEDGGELLDFADFLAKTSSSITAVAHEALQNGPLAGIFGFLNDLGGNLSDDESEEDSNSSTADRSADLSEGDVVDFDYVSLNGSSQHVQGAEVEEVEGDLFKAYVPSKDGYRTFKFDGVTNLVDSDDNSTPYASKTEAQLLAEKFAELKRGDIVDIAFYDNKSGSVSLIGVSVVTANSDSITVKLNFSNSFVAIKASSVVSLNIIA